MRKFFHLFIFLFIQFFSVQFIVAQSDSTQIDSLNQDATFLDYSNARLEYYHIENKNTALQLDTSLFQFQQFNPAKILGFHAVYLSNLGAPSLPRYFEFVQKVGFDEGRNTFSIYQNPIDSAKFYRTNVPFTNVQYVIGGFSEQYFRLLHTQNFGPQLNAALLYERAASEGFFPNDRKTLSNFSITSWYKTKKPFYQIHGVFIYRTNHNSENGGIVNQDFFTSDSLFEATSFRNNASTEWDNLDAKLEQTFTFSNKMQYQINDSTSGIYLNPKIEIVYTIGANNYAYLFEDAQSDSISVEEFYGNVFYLNDTLRDQSDREGFYNRIDIQLPTFKFVKVDSMISRRIFFNLFVEQQLHFLADQIGNTDFKNLLTGFNFHSRQLFNSTTHIFIQGIYDLTKKAYEANGKIQWNTNRIQAEVSLKSALYEPTLFNSYYYGFHLQRNHNLDKTALTKFEANIKFSQLQTQLTAKHSIFSQYAFFDSLVNVQQQDISVFQLSVSNLLKAGDFYLYSLIGFQHVSNPKILYLPQFIGNHSLYLKKQLFKSALLLQTGIDLFYFSQVTLYQYEISTATFYLQNEAQNIQSTFYPSIDVYANFDIKTLRFFIKMENIGQGFISNGYFEALNYPMQPRAFKFGVSWSLYY